MRSAHHLHARTVTGQITTFGAHLVVDEGVDQQKVLDAAEEMLDRDHGFSLSTIQIETEATVENDPAALEYQRDQLPSEP